MRPRTRMPWPAALFLWLVLAAGQILCGPEFSALLLDLQAAAACGSRAWQTTWTWGLRSRWRGATGDDRQRFPDACGPAALSVLLRRRGPSVDQELLWSMCRLPGGGTSLERLAWAARRLGANCDTRYGMDLRQAPLPAVVHLRRRHFVVVRGIDARLASIFDPACGEIAVPVAELLRQASGAALFLRDNDPDAPPVLATAPRPAISGARGGVSP